MNKINILYTSHTARMHYGGQISLYNLVKRIDREKYAPVLLCPSPGDLNKAFQKIKCKTIFFSFPQLTLPNIPIIALALRKTLRILRENDIHLVHSDHPTDTFFLSVVAKILRIPVIWHARVTFSSRLDYINLRLVNRVIGVSEAVANRFRRGGRLSLKYLTIFNGVDCDKFRPLQNNSIRDELGLGAQAPIITIIGQVKPEKGIKDFIDAANSVKNLYPDCRFLIVGTGNDKFIQSMKKRLNEYNLTEHVFWLGFRTDIIYILNVTDLFVLASWSFVEGLPRVVIEAMACGKPVVGTDVQGINEAVINGVTGILVPPHNPENLAQAISKLLSNDRLRFEMGKAGRNRVKKCFSIDESVNKVQDIYSTISIRP